MNRIILALLLLAPLSVLADTTSGQIKELANDIEEARKEQQSKKGGKPRVPLLCGTLRGTGSVTIVEKGEAETFVFDYRNKKSV